MLDRNYIHAESGSVAFGDNARDNVVTINDLDTIITAMRQVQAENVGAEAEQIRQNLDVTKEALASFFRILDREQVPTEKLGDTLNQIAQHHKQALIHLAALETDDSDNKDRLQLARENIDAGRYDAAEQLLQTVEDKEMATLRQAQGLLEAAQQAAEKCVLNAAGARAQRGRLSLTQLRCREAAKHFMAASELVSEGRPEQIEYLRGAQDALVEQFRFSGTLESVLASEIEKKLEAIVDRSKGEPRARALYGLATMQRINNKFDGAIATYQCAATAADEQALDELVYDAWLGVMRAYLYGTRNYAAAAEAFSRAVLAAGVNPTPKQMYEMAEYESQLQANRGELVAALASSIEAIRFARNDSELFYAHLNAGDVLQKFAESCDYRRLVDAKTNSDDTDSCGACSRAVWAAKAYYENARAAANRLGWEFLVKEAEGLISRLDTRMLLIEQMASFERFGQANIFNAQHANDVLVNEDFSSGVSEELISGFPLGPIIEEMELEFQAKHPLNIYLRGIKADLDGNPTKALEYFINAAKLLGAERDSFFDLHQKGTVVLKRPELLRALGLQLLAFQKHDEAFVVFEYLRSHRLEWLSTAFDKSNFTDADRKWIASLVQLDSLIRGKQNILAETAIAGIEHSRSLELLDELKQLKHQRFERQEEKQFESVAKRLKSIECEIPTMTQLKMTVDKVNIPVVLYCVTPVNVVVWVVSPIGVEVKTVFLPEIAVVDKVSKLLDSFRAIGQAFDDKSAKELHAYLIKPFVNHLNQSQVVIIPQGPLVGLPFEVLVDAEDGKFMAEKLSISYAPNAAFAMRALKGRLPIISKITALYDDNIENCTHEVSKMKGVKGVIVGSHSSKGMNAGKMIKLLGDAEIVHVLLHGEYNYDDPLQSTVRVGGAENLQGGFITAAELLAADWRHTQLAVFSSCEGAIVKTRISKEQFGISWALLAGGVDHVVLSRWRVNAASNAAWMETFYKSLVVEKMSPALAANAAMCRMIKSGRRHPYYWAGPQVFGR